MILGWLRKFIPEKAKYFGIKIFHFAIIDNHLHLLVQAKDRDALSGFLRVLSGVIARKVLGIEKGEKAASRMWEARPYSRVLAWGREFKNVLHYIERNVLEAARKISYALRNSPLSGEVRQEIERSLLLAGVSNSGQLVLRI